MQQVQVKFSQKLNFSFYNDSDRIDCKDSQWTAINFRHTKIIGKINQIKVPVLAVNAEDDPFSPGETLPHDEAKQSDSFALLSTTYGGHIGFLEGLWPSDYHFCERVFEQFTNMVTNISKPNFQIKTHYIP